MSLWERAEGKRMSLLKGTHLPEAPCVGKGSGLRTSSQAFKSLKENCGFHTFTEYVLISFFEISFFLQILNRDFSGNPVIKTPCFQFRGMSSIPGQGTKVPHAKMHGQKKKKKKT